MLNSSNFVKPFHCQSFTLYGIPCPALMASNSSVLLICMPPNVHQLHYPQFFLLVNTAYALQHLIHYLPIGSNQPMSQYFITPIFSTQGIQGIPNQLDLCLLCSQALYAQNMYTYIKQSIYVALYIHTIILFLFKLISNYYIHKTWEVHTYVNFHGLCVVKLLPM